MKMLAGNQNKIILLGSRKQIRYYERLNLGDVRIECHSPDIRYYPFIPLWLSVLVQIPLLIGMQRNDKKSARIYAGKYQADMIISDNRYGFYCSDVPSILVTHQVWPLFPFFKTVLHRWFEKRIYPRFAEIWVPDHRDEQKKLSGILSGARNLPNIRYIGLLSVYAYVSHEHVPAERYDECWLLSGPENEQKRFFYELFRNHHVVAGNAGKRIAVCGTVPLNIKQNNIRYYPCPEPPVVKMLLMSSEKVYARIGYTTLMDAHVLGIMHKMHFSPTPGQTEQEYLFERHRKK